MITEISETLIDQTLDEAAEWQQRANRLLTAEERIQQEQMRRLLHHPPDKVVLAKLFDQSFRSNDSNRVADQIHYLLKKHGTPEFFSTTEKALLLLFQGLGRHLPGLSIPKMIAKMRGNSRHLVIAGEREPLNAHLEKRRAEGVRVNLNHLGEAVLGEAEAEHRLQRYLRDLGEPMIEYISVKISTIYSQIQPLAFEHSVAVLRDRLAQLYRAAQAHTFSRRDGSLVPKFVNLDMEEYHDVGITVAAFRQTLDREEFKPLTAGIVLQAYLPESYAIQQELTDWARGRVAAGGAPIKIRIVKGANMEMEQIEAALNNWPLAPFDNKRDVDANYKRMLLFGLRPENIAAARLGVASHNLFELAFARQVARANGVEALMEFEMLEGMADHVRRALSAQGLPMLLYAPVADEKTFLNAIAYLIRRMDENTGQDNFLRHIPFLKAGSDTWQTLADGFIQSCRRIAALPQTPHRTQNRSGEEFPDVDSLSENRFYNEPDTDWSLPANHAWAEQIRRQWRKSASDEPLSIPIVIAGEELAAPRGVREIIDINQLPERVGVARFYLANARDIGRAVDVARRDPDGWRSLGHSEREAVLARAARNLRRMRGDLIGAATASTAKLFGEADIEVSEAIDFAEYYPRSVRAFTKRPNLHVNGKGVGVVVSPWNFPIAIPCGGIAAALAAGNTVIFKPSSDAIPTAWLLCRAFWDAGVGRNALQFVPCSGAVEGRRLVADPQVDFVILTGGTETGLQMLADRPDLFLAAETGGKNATIVTAMADRDQAIKNVIQSAFGHGGQKCSATSLLILEKEVYNDPQFKRTLVDAATSWPVGSAWEFHTRLNPLIRPPEGALQRALTTLEAGESWALAPHHVDGNPHLWTPGIKWGVQPGSPTHTTELFGPVLAVMRADDLEEAVAIANQTGYGLTAGLESLDEREITCWKETIRAGNLYINRGTTGAVTLRQSFGGMGKSSIGPAIKAGGPNYVAQFMTFTETEMPAVGPILREHSLLVLAQRWWRKCYWHQLAAHWRGDIEKAVQAIESYLYHAQLDFIPEHDYFHLRGQDNLLRHLPVGKLVVCVHPDDTLFDIVARLAASLIAGCRTVLNLPPGFGGQAADFLTSSEAMDLLKEVEVWRLDPAGLAPRVVQCDRLRYAAADRVPREVYAAAAQNGTYIARAPVLMDGRVELLHYFLNQSISNTYHRYGNLGERGRRSG
jgi:RHH-type transcriptional regulator, proline utilization regulon repressor / proline dehydrogenase / delta 1-pyrroline-5-carboxylate dehydrogenase